MLKIARSNHPSTAYLEKDVTPFSHLIKKETESIYATKFHLDVLWSQCKDNVK